MTQTCTAPVEPPQQSAFRTWAATDAGRRGSQSTYGVAMNEPAQNASARPGRSWGATAAWIVVALLLAGAAYAVASWAMTAGATLGNGGWKALVGWPIAGLLGIGSLVALVGIFTASGAATCPTCQARITAFDATRGDGLALFCPGCQGYALVRGGVLVTAPENHVHPRPVFAAEFKPAEVRWCGCVVCGASATRELEHELQETQILKNVAASTLGVAMMAAGGGGSIETGGGKVWTIRVPYCDQHQQGVAFRPDFGTPIVQFRSLAAFRAFCAANGLEPRDAPDDLRPS